MSAAKHTPGPWACIVEGNDAFVMPAGDSPCVTLITLRGAGTAHSESLANARLIAAAPGLLEALLAVAGYSDAPHVDPVKALTYIQQTARAAILKATGEGA